MKIALIAAELFPLAKAGGLADAVAGLARMLSHRGHDVITIIPGYPGAIAAATSTGQVRACGSFAVALGQHTYRFQMYAARLGDSGLDVRLINCPELFPDDQVYRHGEPDAVRFAAFTHAALVACQHMRFSPDIVHCHDWHTALAPLLLRTTFAWDRLFEQTRSLLTIHNIGYQGIYSRELCHSMGLADLSLYLDATDLAAGNINVLRIGLAHAHSLNTVSISHADEIMNDDALVGDLRRTLHERNDRVLGITNGIDERTWDPATDPHLWHRYNATNVDSGKRLNKQRLFRELHMSADHGLPVIALVSRLTHQKGIDLALGAMDTFMRHNDVCLVVAGCGDACLEDLVVDFEARWQGRVGYFRQFSEQAARCALAAADILLMPSRYEPCGLTQMYAMRFGTVPVVRAVGGLKDTVDAYHHGTAGNGSDGEGILISSEGVDQTVSALCEALKLVTDKRQIQLLRARLMQRDRSWRLPAEHYERTYHRLHSPRHSFGSDSPELARRVG